MAGHSKWANIKRRKGAQDAKRGRLFTKINKEISVAARLGGGNPESNPRLRRAVEEAKSVNMPSDNVERAIKKGLGELEGVRYESVTYEGVGPSGALFLAEASTDNRNRTAAEVRKIFSKHGGQLGESGSAAWAFDEKGIIKLPAEDATEDDLLEVAAGAGAEDAEQVGTQWVISTPRAQLEHVREALEQSGIRIDEAKLQKIPKTPRIVEGDHADRLIQLFEALEDHDDVENVFADFELSQQALTALEQRA